MTSLWKKFRKNQEIFPIKGNNEISENESNESSSRQKKIWITAADENQYFERKNNVNDDPISLGPQIIQNLKELLQHKEALSHFTEFLHSLGAHSYILFWKDCEKYECLVHQFSSKQKKKEESENNIKDSKDNIKSSQLNLMLPDLVSNIPKDAIASPISSPEKQMKPPEAPSTEQEVHKEIISQSIEDFDNCIWNYDASISRTSEQHINQNPLPSYENLLEFTAIDIYNKYMKSTCDNSIKIAQTTQELITAKLQKKDFTSTLFSIAKDEIFCLLNQDYFPKYMNSEHHLKHKVDVLTSPSVPLQDIINCDNTFPYLMEFMEQEGASQLLEFWVSISNFRQHLASMTLDNLSDAQQAQADAMILYDKYFSMQASAPLGFSHVIRFMVESSICQDKGPESTCFDAPLGIVLLVIERDLFRQYISSFFHIKCLTELINSVQTNVKKHRRTASESTCSSEYLSVASAQSKCTNTLLAMDSSSKNIQGLVDNTFAMRIDSNQILDPDALWRRKNFTKLSCGYVDKLGRFESDLLPEPFKQESRLSKLKKLVNLEENKIKEEMAYKVAEMIIKDVTNITLNPTQTDDNS